MDVECERRQASTRMSCKTLTVISDIKRSVVLGQQDDVAYQFHQVVVYCSPRRCAPRLHNKYVALADVLQDFHATLGVAELFAYTCTCMAFQVVCLPIFLQTAAHKGTSSANAYILSRKVPDDPRCPWTAWDETTPVQPEWRPTPYDQTHSEPPCSRAVRTSLSSFAFWA